jgi:hypothetical protein
MEIEIIIIGVENDYFLFTHQSSKQGPYNKTD